MCFNRRAPPSPPTKKGFIYVPMLVIKQNLESFTLLNDVLSVNKLIIMLVWVREKCYSLVFFYHEAINTQISLSFYMFSYLLSLYYYS